MFSPTGLYVPSGKRLKVANYWPRVQRQRSQGSYLAEVSGITLVCLALSFFFLVALRTFYLSFILAATA